MFIFPLEAFASCYADSSRKLEDWSVKGISVARGNYQWGMENPESVKCYYKIAKLESEVAILKGEYSSAVNAANDILEAFPGDYAGLLYLHLSLKAQGKEVPEWYSINRYPNEYSNKKLMNNLSKSIILKTANKALKQGASHGTAEKRAAP